MTLDPGTRLGPYEIQAAIGAGGMGEVYRARDTRLDRTVAIKILPAESAGDPAFRERFDREARLISSLSHPHICALFDVGRQDGIAFLVIEHLEGETLASRLEKGPLRLDLALQIAVQIAGALDAAHRAGVVHRDVKPGNVMLTRTGAKLLDFGLARQGAFGAARAGLSMLPTTPGVTAQGTILGTLQYMSPEQLDGSEADAPSDIFSFGALVYEMVTGRKAFEGKSQASLIAAIMSADPPPVPSLAPMAPAALDRVVRKCLAKDPDQRWQSASDLRDELTWIGTSSAAVTVESSSRATAGALAPKHVRLGWIVAGIAGVALLAAAVLGRAGYLAPAQEPQPIYRTSLMLPVEAVPEGVAGRRFAISPDGRRLVFVALRTDRTRLLWLRPLDSLTAQPLPATEGANGPFWSPDSKYVAFVAQGRLKKVDVSGGPAVTIATEALDLGGTWNEDDVILFVPRLGALHRVGAAGGTQTPVTVVVGATRHSDPFFLPDRRHFLYQVFDSQKAEASGIYVGSLDPQEPSRRILPVNSNTLYSQGHLLFVRERTLMAQPFDVTSMNVIGSPTPVAENVGISGLNAAAALSVSASGALVYRTASVAIRTQLAWLDRSGVRRQTVGEATDQMAVELSPDDARLVVSALDAARDTRDVWTYDLARGLRTRFTFDAADEIHAVWSADGRQVVFDSRRSGRLGLFLKPASGAGSDTALFESDRDNLYPVSWSRDGRFLSYFTGNAASPTGNDIWILPLSGDQKPIPFMLTEFNERYGQFSPDGRWIAYASTESGRDEVYVAPFPGPGGKWQVSSGGGSWPRWRGDGRELFFADAEGMLMAATVDGSGSAFVVGAVQPLFPLRMRTAAWVGSTSYNYDVTADGQRFLINATEDSPSDTPITLLLNWAGNLR